jgi:two-component system chemotaxis response regulator CheB
MLSEKEKPARGGLRPCADIFFESLVNCSLDHFVCGVLTGMGSDACKGIQLLKRYKEIKVVAQNQETCVVYGMPRAVAQAGVVDEVVPLEDMAGTIIKKLGV